MSKPLVAVVGRPNVGKSTFFNKIAGKRISIVEDTPGVTRDRIYADCEWLNHKFTLIDTGGIEPRTDDILLKQMRRQAEVAIDTCDVILFFTDGRAGLTANDEDVATMLRRSGKPVILVVNKVDFPEMTDTIYDFYALGLGEPFAISSTNMLGLGDLLDEVVAHFPEEAALSEEEEHTINIAVVGRPNVGKSSLVNRILGQERSMVSEIAGTTRDAIDTAFVRDGQRFNIIDTAGIRRKRAIEEESIERYSIVRALAAVRRCDVALIVINAEDGVTEQDTKVAGYVHEEGKAAIIVVNKWDAIEKDTNTMETFRKRVTEDLKFMDYAPVVFISALTGQRVANVLSSVKDAYEQTSRRITTGLLNDVLGDATAALQPPVSGGRRLKIYYATQQSTCPPTFVFFVNDEKLMHFAYQRYLENQFRKSFGFEGTPIRFILRQKNQKEE
ncbi:MAG: ribosome biogenesis GTPase Der [Clostridiales bacterium]|nr:ribosome biogenesis GTPase Der [Clostridiales bacterium]MDY5350003.1 ribosome biogenesis GTPase Der [Candidatus Ventricola sp.]MDY5515566.1 ribosome biogenesis GTPase Der [Candidatus Ventricola sp.]